MDNIQFRDSIELVDIDSLIPYSNNPKAHPAEQVEKIAASINEYGWDQPIVVESDGKTIIKGHGRLRAAKKLGLKKVPVIGTNLEGAEAKAARLADNRTAMSDWLEEELAIELEDLDEQEFDLELTGFDEDEWNPLINGSFGDKPVQELREDITEMDLGDIKILNLYTGIGGNRKLWGNEASITAVEYNEEIVRVYQDHYPNDKVIVGDAHKYLEKNFQDYDFIWSSPPCPTHSRIRKNTAVNTGNANPVYPDMRLYQEILLLEGYFEGKYVVENVQSWFDPLIKPQSIDRHYFWANFNIKKTKIDKGENKHNNSPKRIEKYLGIDLSSYNFSSDYPKQKILNNCVHPTVGKIILESAIESKI